MGSFVVSVLLKCTDGMEFAWYCLAWLIIRDGMKGPGRGVDIEWDPWV
jgi:hypothetical protein